MTPLGTIRTSGSGRPGVVPPVSRGRSHGSIQACLFGGGLSRPRSKFFLDLYGKLRYAAEKNLPTTGRFNSIQRRGWELNLQKNLKERNLYMKQWGTERWKGWEWWKLQVKSFSRFSSAVFHNPMIFSCSYLGNWHNMAGNKTNTNGPK